MKHFYLSNGLTAEDNVFEKALLSNWGDGLTFIYTTAKLHSSEQIWLILGSKLHQLRSSNCPFFALKIPADINLIGESSQSLKEGRCNNGLSRPLSETHLAVGQSLGVRRKKARADVPKSK